jgi:hypothetical protein
MMKLMNNLVTYVTRWLEDDKELFFIYQYFKFGALLALSRLSHLKSAYNQGGNYG